MQARHVLVTVFALLVVGSGLAWFLFSGEGDNAGRGDGAVKATAPSDAGAERAQAELASVGTIEELGDEREERGAVKTELVTAKTPDAPVAADEDTPELSGLVVDPGGRPVVGARVLAADRRGFPLDYVARGEVPEFVNRVQTTTDDEGRYELSGLSPGSIRILVKAPGFAPHSDEDIPVPEVEDYKLDDVVLQPGALLEGIVVDHVGSPVPGAELFLVEDGFGFGRFFSPGLGEKPSAEADERGRFRIDELALGAWRIRVETKDHPDRSFEGFAERAGEVVGGLRFELERGDTIAGRVIDVPTGEKGDLDIRATLKDQNEFFGFSRGDNRDAKVAKDGSFVVKGVKPDLEYNLQVRQRPESSFRGEGWNAVTRSAKVPALAGTRGVEVSYQPEASIAFQVVDDETGTPLEDFQVKSGVFWKEPLLSDAGRMLEEHPEGRVRIGNLRPSSDRDTAELQVDAVGYETFEKNDVPIVISEETDLGVIRLKPLPLVRVTVLDAETGEPIPGAHVSIQEDREEGGFGRGGSTRSIRMEVDDGEGPRIVGELGRNGETNEEGLAMLTSLEDKRCTIKATHDDYAPGSVSDLYLAPGKATDQTLRLGKGGSVVARVLDEAGSPVTGARVEHRSAESSNDPFAGFFGGRSGAKSVSDSAGEVVFGHLAPGVHRFRLEKGNGGGAAFGRGSMVVRLSGNAETGAEPGWEEVDVAEGGQAEVILVQTARGSLVGRVWEAGVALGGATMSLSPESDGDGFGSGGFEMMGGGDDGVRSDSSGDYLLNDVEPGRYLLKVSHPKRRMPMEFKVEVDAGEKQFDVDLPLSIIEGRITDDQGSPLSGVEVTAKKASSGGGGRGRMMMFQSAGGGGGGGVVSLGDEMGDASYTDVDGYYILRGVLSDEELIVSASGDNVQGGESDPITVAPDAVLGGVNLVLEAAGSLEVEVLTADGSSAQFVVVRANYQDEVPEDVKTSGADPKFAFVQNGSSTLSGMRPGRWTVSVSGAGPSSSDGGDPDEQEVEVEAGVAGVVTFHMP